MSRKHLGMKRPIKQFNKAVEIMDEYIQAFSFLPPRGDVVKECAINEWKQVINDVIIQINNIKNTQIDLILREDKEWK